MKTGSAAWFVYIVRCADATLYTGIARDVAARIRAHEAGRGARYTRSRGPLELCGVRRCATKGEALSLEIAIKRLDRANKLALLRPRRLAAFARARVRARVARAQNEKKTRIAQPNVATLAKRPMRRLQT